MCTLHRISISSVSEVVLCFLFTKMLGVDLPPSPLIRH